MIDVKDLHVRYGAVHAVRGVSFSVADGELVTLLGANGAGKSSSILCVAGAIKAAGGSVTLDGKDMTSASPEAMCRAGVATVPETRDVFPDLTVDQNLTLGAYVRRSARKAVAEDRARMFEMFPRLAERREQAAGTLSGGEQQMLVVARALMSRPRVLLLDEPSLGLAPAIVDQIFEMIAELKAQKLTILLVEQNARKALQVADRAYVLRLGEIAGSGTAQEIASSTDLDALYLGG
ncbi:ABC transporter ATP-binding protein [Roseovarius sp. Pro17]|uniref:ABC transporter ATP-binding protein n=1 Tax=Roseovarius sp. Pro17 TaxID=3108175 RepID=UPI002D76B6D2|nr:ABC transporter ATP-binding protein [Roseovarius sp. Pro17]